MERKFSRRIDSLEEIAGFVESFVDEAGLGEQESFDLNLIIEELFTNMVKYNPEGRHDISVQLDREGDALLVCLTDFDVEPYDVTQAPPVDTSQPLAERRIGGLGLHFIRKIADRITYDYENRNSRITVTKSVGPADV
jgi:anti-sigma regulatory factor (Ser/Thr protein kinase)